MQCVVGYSFLLICCTSWAASYLKVTTLIRVIGHDIIIECATDKTPQDWVYMYKQQGASKPQEIFYFYKDNSLTFKTMNKSKVDVSGALLNLNVTLLNVTAEDIGLYWCEFNLDEQSTVGSITWLWIEEEKKECPEVLPHVKIFLILCAVMCIIGLSCVILKHSR